MLLITTGTQEEQEGDEGPLELAEQGLELSVAEGEGLPEEDEDHDEDEAGDDDLDGLGGGRGTMKK